MYATVSESNVTAYINNSLPFSSQLITSNFSSILIVFCRVFIWISLGDADLRFSLILVRKASAVGAETK
jgi:hypothetical protein